MNLFGIEITRAKPAEDISGSFASPVTDDGSTVISGANSAAYYGIYMDLDGKVKNEQASILKYREIANYPEVDIALQDIINEAIPFEDNTSKIEVDLEDADFSDSLKEKIRDEFKAVIRLLDYDDKAPDLFRRWYVDGRMFFHALVDKTNLQKGIVELRPVEATKIKKIKEFNKVKSPLGVDMIEEGEEYYVYNEAGFQSQSAGSSTVTNSQLQGVKISPDAIVYSSSGLLDADGKTIISYLDKAIRPVNQLRMLEQAMIIYRVSRAPERRIFYVDVGNLPKAKAEQYLKDIMNRYRNKMVYDAKTGEVRDDKKYMSMLEDFWMPRRDGGKGTEITTLQGAQNLNQLDDVMYFQENLFKSLNVPVSRLKQETGFTLGQDQTITRDEVRFQKFINKIRRRFSTVFYEALRIQLILKGICNSDEWEDVVKPNLKFVFQTDNEFSALKTLSILQTRMALMPQIDPYLGKYFSKKYVQTDVLGMSEEQIESMDQEIEDEKGDPTAQPTFQGMDPMMGGDPSMQGQDDPNAYQGMDQYGQDDEDPEGTASSGQYPFANK